MTMGVDVFGAVLWFAWGALLSLLHFGGLRRTLAKLPNVRHPLALYYGSALARFTLTIAGAWLAAQNGLTAVAACMLGLTAVRLVLVQVYGLKGEAKPA